MGGGGRGPGTLSFSRRRHKFNLKLIFLLLPERRLPASRVIKMLSYVNDKHNVPGGPQVPQAEASWPSEHFVPVSGAFWLWLIFARHLNMVRHAFVVKCKIEY